MMKSRITAAEMKAIDINASRLGMEPLLLMENAGRAVAEIIAAHIRSEDMKNKKTGQPEGKQSDNPPKVFLFAGLGNNGGDVFVAARHLDNFEISSAIILTGTKQQIKTLEARKNYDLLKQSDRIKTIELKSESDLKEIVKDENNILVIADGIFGTGFSGKAAGIEKEAIETINLIREKNKTVFVLSVDIPSGLEAAAVSLAGDDKEGETETKNIRNGETEEETKRRNAGDETIVAADSTVTFHKMKTYLEEPKNKRFAGEIIVKQIGVPENAEKYVGAGDLAALYRRDLKSKKGDSGKIMVVAGGTYTGAPALAGMAALRTGCDIAAVAAPRQIYDAVASFSPELIVKKLSADLLSEEDIPILKELIPVYDAVIIGPGLGSEPTVLKTVAELIPVIQKAVIDADAIRPEIMDALEKRPHPSKTEIILTPHYGEFCRLADFCGIKVAAKRDENTAAELEKYTAEICEKLNVTVLLKGATDFICGNECGRYNATGNSGMTIGGTGDVLAGIVGGLLAKNKAFESACCGAFICGTAGDMAYEKKGNALIPSDMLKKIPKAIHFENKSKMKKQNKSKNKIDQKTK